MAEEVEKRGHLELVDDGCGRGGSAESIEVEQNIRKTRPYLPEIVRAFKSFSARRINVLRNTLGIPVWQRNYYEHIVRNEAEWERIQMYIRENPRHWKDERENLRYGQVSDLPVPDPPK
jgi:putative transposase